MSRYRKWINSLSWPALGAAAATAVAALFAINAATWWIAHQLSWWLYALAFTVGTFCWQAILSTVSVIREHRRKAKVRGLLTGIRP